MPKVATGRKRKTEIEAVKHKDKRVNIPTEELRDFVSEEEKTPRKLLYPRDPSLDPQLVWKSKDEQDARPLEVPAVPIYIQEKVHPQALIEDLRRSGKNGSEPQIQLFGDFNGLKFESLIDFYHHEQSWTNRLILGDSLLVMASLAEKEGLKGKVQMIYVDPPYGIKFGSNWQVSTRKRDVKDGRVEDVNREPEVVKAFRDTWSHGIHSYLAYLRDRLAVAYNLLSESGSIFVQIGETNVHLVRCLMDEVFGSENCISLITFRTTSDRGGEILGSNSDYLLWYAKDSQVVKHRNVFRPRLLEDDIGQRYTRVQVDYGVRRFMTADERREPKRLPAGSRIYRHDNLTSQGSGESGRFQVPFQGDAFSPGNGTWKTHEAGIRRLSIAGRLAAPSPNSLAYVRFFDDFPFTTHANVWSDTQTGAFTDPKIYVVQTNTKVIERCLLLTTDPGDLVLDPTCGSGTTAYVAEQWGRRWITIDTSRVALTLARTRLMAARFPYYLLADSEAGVQKETEIAGARPIETKPENDIRKGFVYKRVPHITLKSIANNDEIDVIHACWREKLDPIRTELNRTLKQKWENWEVPRESETEWPDKALKLHEQWWKLCCERQQEIEASIARHAEREILYDDPYDDPKRIRVTGPFTVESLSPHRMLSTDDDQLSSQPETEKNVIGQFETMIIENLRKAGVQNTVKHQRLKFDRLDAYAGTWIQAAGEYTESGRTKRVAIFIGPEHGTVGPEMVKEAAKEAVQGVGFDLLIVSGFAFDPHVSEEAKRYGKLNILIARMNPDLTMGNELLKKTGAGNLFMVFGEPDLTVQRKNGHVIVDLKGVDVYDPTTGQIRNSSTDDIACWFIDTDYNGESFFVRHAYFTGADEPYEKLKKALRAEIDEQAWSALYSTTSRPFPVPKGNGKGKPKIAVKVINHYGDEVMKVYPL